MTTSVRRNLLLMLLLCAFAVGVALYTQHVLGMRPCAWCIFQRLILLLIAVIILFTLILSGRNYLIPRLATGATIALGLSGGFAAWHQFTVAAIQFSCTQTLAERVIAGFGLDAFVPWLFEIQASCMDARADLFGIDYALWTLALFSILTVWSVITLVYTFQD